MRLLICAGGTGGGVYPALAVYKAIMSRDSSTDTLWVGGEGGMEAKLIERTGIAFKSIPAAGLHGVGLRTLPHNLGKMVQGVSASRHILSDFHPDVMMFTGGYVAFPMALAGWRIPSLVYVPDIEPGLALRTISNLARCIAVTTEDSRHYFSSRTKVVVSGYPVRPELMHITREDALAAFHLDQDTPVLLVFGGSKGARSINQAVIQHLEQVLALAQVIHISGELEWPLVEKAKQGLDTKLSDRYHAYPYLHNEMPTALVAANLVLSRAGASVLGEFPMVGLPAILVPYPHAWRYQKLNAQYLVDKGAAIVVQDEDLQDGLIPALSSLLSEPARLEVMENAMRSLAQPQAAAIIAHELERLAKGER